MRIPPLFLGLGAERAELLGLAGRVGSLHRLAGRRVPEFHADRQVAIGEAGGQAGEIVGGRIFDRVAELLEDAAEDLGVEVDAGPVEQRDLDRIARFRRLRVGGWRPKADSHKRSRAHSQKLDVHSVLPLYELRHPNSPSRALPARRSRQGRVFHVMKIYIPTFRLRNGRSVQCSNFSRSVGT